MADAGNLQKFPLEIRKEIYKYLLVELKKIGILRRNCRGGAKAARMDNHYDPKRRGKVCDSRPRKWVATPPRAMSILLVNRQINHEARQVLYGSNHFEFENALALDTFLKHTGDAINHIRHISLIGPETLHRGSWASMDRCLVRRQSKGPANLGVLTSRTLQRIRANRYQEPGRALQAAPGGLACCIYPQEVESSSIRCCQDHLATLLPDRTTHFTSPSSRISQF